MWTPQSTSRGHQRALKALDEGRIPGKPGPKPLSEEERKARRKATYTKHRKLNLEKRRKIEAAWHRKKTAEKAIVEGRVPGQIGHLSTMTKSELFEYLDQWRGDDRKFIQQTKMQNYRAIKLGIEGTITVKDVIFQLEAQKGCCAFCGTKFTDKIPEIDHWIPFKLGGINSASNIKLLHRSCNRTKGSKHPNEFTLN